MSDAITIVRSYGPRLAKHVMPSRIAGYDNAKRVDLFERGLDGLGDLEELLRHSLAARPDCAVVRGAIADPAHTRRVRRLLYADPQIGEAPTLVERARYWLALDIDSLPGPSGLDPADLVACAKHVAGVLPAAFHNVSLVVQATASHLIDAALHLRLWFWLSRPTTGAELKFWLRSSPVDAAVFGAAQLIYTAAPLFASGAVDPLPSRLAVLFGAHEEVAVPDPAALVPPPPSRPRPPPPPGDPCAASYAAGALAAIAARVLRAPRGTRHDTIILAARRLAELEHARLVTAEEVEQLLVAAARGAGLEADGRDAEREVGAILAWARRSCMSTEGERQ
jgi:hypothetical protein